MRLVLFTEKEPEKGKSVELSSKSLDWLWRDFSPYRAVAGR